MENTELHTEYVDLSGKLAHQASQTSDSDEYLEPQWDPCTATIHNEIQIGEAQHAKSFPDQMEEDARLSITLAHQISQTSDSDDYVDCEQGLNPDHAKTPQQPTNNEENIGQPEMKLPCSQQDQPTAEHTINMNQNELDQMKMGAVSIPNELKQSETVALSNTMTKKVHNISEEGVGWLESLTSFWNPKVSDAAKVMMVANNNTHLAISLDADVFKKVFRCLNSEDKLTDKEQILPVLDQCIENMFWTDFPFYLIIVEWLSLKGVKNQSLIQLAGKCSKKLEEMERNHLVETLVNFFQRKDFTVVLNKGEENVLVLLRITCRKMAANISTSNRNHHLLYRKLLWISIMLKCNIGDHHNSAEIWNTYVLQGTEKLDFDTGTIDDLDKGFGLMEILSVDSSLKPSTRQLIYFATRKKRAFHEIYSYAMTVAKYTSEPVDFITQLFGACIQDLPNISPADLGNYKYENMIKEGRQFIEKINNLLMSHGISQFTQEYSQNQYKLLEWLLNICFARPDTSKCIKCVKDLFGDGKVTEIYSARLIQQAIEKRQKAFLNLTAKQMLELFIAVNIWSNEYLECYFNQYELHPYQDDIWSKFFAEIAARSPEAKQHHYLLEFLKRYSKMYQKDEDRMKFITDMLLLKAAKLFTGGVDYENENVQKGFVQFVQDYSERCHLSKEKLLKTLLDAVSKSKSTDGFNQLVLTALQKVIVPTIHELQNSVPIVLKVTVVRFKKWTRSDLADAFCWSIVTSCCSNIIITEECSFLRYYESVIELCSLQDSAVHTHCSDYLVWLNRLKTVVSVMYDKLLSGKCNYDQIIFLQSHASNFAKLCNSCIGIEYKIAMDIVQLAASNFEELMVLLNMTLVISSQGNPGKLVTLQSILHKYSVHIPKQISQHLILSDAPSSNEILKYSEKLKNIVIARTKSDVFFQITRCTELRILNTLWQDLSHFMLPLKQYIIVLAYFYFNHSVIFDMYMELTLKTLLERNSEQTKDYFDDENNEEITHKFPQECTIKILAQAASMATDKIMSLIEGKLTYSQLLADGHIDLNEVNVDDEFNVLHTFAQSLSVKSSVGLEGLKNLLEVFQLPEHIDCIHDVCEQYNLKGCLDDAILNDLLKKANYLKSPQSKEEMTTIQAIKELGVLRQWLCYSSPLASHCTELFKSVKDCAPFRAFVLEMKFDGESGRALFNQQYQLVTAELQHEEYNENILNHLTTAYNLIFPFLNPEQSFTSMMTQVTKLDITNGLSALKTVNENITTIHLWFSRVEGDTLQNLSLQLQCITETGTYEYYFDQHSPVLLFMVYNENKKMSREQLSDFVRRLGFLDVGGESVKQFQEINDMAETLMTLYAQLRELGHSKYLQDCIRLKCNSIALENEVVRTKQVLIGWRDDLVNLRRKNKWLLFFSIPKLLFMYKKLNSTFSTPSSESLFHEIGFLFNNNHAAVMEMEMKAKMTLESSMNIWTLDKMPPIHAVSHYLMVLLEDHTLPNGTKYPVVATYDECVQLHSCNPKNLVPTILNIFKGVPEVFQVFQCKVQTTEDELRLFLERADQYTFLHVLLEVNKLSFQTQEFLMKYFGTKRSTSEEKMLHVELLQTNPSNFQELPWVIMNEHKEGEKAKFLENVYLDVKLIHGKAGDGKTYYIRKRLAESSASTVISINEAFTPLAAIMKLRCLPYQMNCAIHINFFLIPSQKHTEHSEYCCVFEIVQQFLFDLIILGYVEDTETGLSFKLPGGLNWKFYIEVPCQDVDEDSDKSLEQFCDKIPLFNLIGIRHKVSQNNQFTVSGEVQLVCKYLKAYKNGQINRVLKGDQDVIRFSTDPDLLDEECIGLIELHANHLSKRKITQTLFTKYMYDRCKFLDVFPGFNYNSGRGEKDKSGHYTNTRQLGSTIIGRMLSEVKEFCDSSVLKHWNQSPHHQLIYEFSDGGGSLGFITSLPERLLDEERMKLKQIGVKIPSISDMHSREHLDICLARTMNIPLQNGRLQAIDDAHYVLTLDYTIKMLSIHERCRCGVPVIIQGETGVGKTALVKMLSDLWNYSFNQEWRIEKSRLCEFIVSQSKLKTCATDKYMECVKSIQENKSISHSGLLAICEQSYAALTKSPDLTDTCMSENSTPTCNMPLKEYLLQMRRRNIIALLQSESDTILENLFSEVEASNDPHVLSKLLSWMWFAHLKTMFYKILVHAALTPKNIEDKLNSIFAEARSLCKSKYSCNAKITVFLDEINTATCLGLFKELIMDKTLNGEQIPMNVFIIAACNPHRGSSLASHSEDEWLRGSYYVRSLPPSLQMLIWDYGSLSNEQEEHYIDAKMKMLDYGMNDVQLKSLSKLIVTSQELMRKYAQEQLKRKYESNEATIRSHSCVSQRDIERVLNIYQWVIKSYNHQSHSHRQIKDRHRCAVMIALGLVYYMRLNKHYREKYQKHMERTSRKVDLQFLNVFKDELDFYTENVELPSGIAKTQALKENIFATIICTVTRTPLIIVGAPGSSKTLSFNIVVSNLKGQESKKSLFRVKIFPSLDPHYYQCSKHTTSAEVDTVFLRAKNRQLAHSKALVPSNCVVFMDEAGLPEESHESLKVLHYHLDKSEVSFVAITNHVLDAAKTNRAISLYRPESPSDDLETLANGCLGSTNVFTSKDVSEFCQAYLSINQHFGLRDFIHFVIYLRRFMTPNESKISIVMKGLERNFNGFENFDKICDQFLKLIDSSYKTVQKRNILDILSDSLCDRPSSEYSSENEVRYKLIIDPSEDDSLVRLLFMSKKLVHDQNTHVFVSSDLPGDSDLQKVNTIAAIIHSMKEGHTIMMAQTDDIYESFYDLFNQHFRKICDPTKGTRYYTNIAIGAHSKPCRVHPNFQCVVVVKKSEVLNMPPPFLNRFEKFCITHSSLLDAALHHLPPCMRIIIQAVKEKLEEFIGIFKGDESFYGLKTDTVNSLLLELIPMDECIFKIDKPAINESETLCSIVRAVQAVLQYGAGFHFIACTMEELELDCIHIYPFISADSVFDGILQSHISVNAVFDAFSVLFEAPAPNDEHCNLKWGLSPDASMVVAVLTQWLIRYLSKRLMQVMTPEALTIHRMKISSTYIENYLNFQVHFSLKKLITVHSNALQSGDKRSYCPSKLLCYTRLSSLLHTIPVLFPSTKCTNDGSEISDVKKLVFEDADSVMILKLTTLTTAANISEVLKVFSQHKIAKIMLLVVNMLHVSRKAVNHIRIMVEEAERQVPSQNKLYVLLLQFPPSKQHYPTLFLKGWNYYYIDTISHNTDAGTLDIENWFKKCCFSEKYIEPPCHSLLCTLQNLLHESIPVIASQVIFGNLENSKSPFNTKMSLSQRKKVLELLLIKKKMGSILCARFRTYWTPNLMVSFVEQAARFSHGHHSTLNITDPIQASFKLLFFDFMAYMIARINEYYDLDILLFSDCSQSVEQLFDALLSVYPIPSFEQIKVLRNSRGILQTSMNPHKFPFFHLVMKQTDQLVDDCRKQLANKVDIPEDKSNGSFTMVSTGALFDLLKASVQEHKKCESNDPLGITLRSINEDQEIWHRYLNDFCYYKMNLSFTSENHLINSLFHISSKLSCAEKFLHLHTYVSEHKVDIAKMATLLRPLGNFNAILTMDLQDELQCKPDYGLVVSGIVIDSLFGALINCPHTPEEIGRWQLAYKVTLALPSLKDLIHRSMQCLSYTRQRDLKLKFDIMESSFTFLQSQLSNTEDIHAILSMHDDILSWVSSIYSRGRITTNGISVLAEIVNLAMKYVRDEDVSRFNNLRLMERLFDHFFYEMNTEIPQCYTQSDCEFFLEISNTQFQWLEGITFQSVTMSNCRVPSMSISVMKYYFSRILLCKLKTDTFAQPLGLYHEELRAAVANVLLSVPDLGIASCYIPLFYQLCPNVVLKDKMSCRMNQPLAHLYFLTVMEHLYVKCKDWPVPALLSIIQQCDADVKSKEKKETETIVLFIEMQATLQYFIHRCALLIDPDDSTKMADIASTLLNTSVNSILDDTTTGGGQCRGHFHALLWHILKHLKQEKFVLLLTERCEPQRKAINSLNEVKSELKNFTIKSQDILSFMLTNVELEFYKKICSIMKDQQHIQDLLTVAEECTAASNSASKEAGCFRMMVWLVSYYEFYDKNIKSPSISDAIGSQEFSKYFEHGEIKLIQSFINCDLMINIPECERLYNQPRNQTNAITNDPINELFILRKKEDELLRHTLANLIAAVFASPRKSNHLWYHLYALHELKDTFIPGYLIPTSKVNGNPYHYDCGVELTHDGQFGRTNYRNTQCSLHSYYLLLWANFGAICVGLLTQPDTDDKIRGPIFSPQLSLHHYCIAQLRTMWVHFHLHNIDKPPSERTIVMSKCFRKFYEIHLDPSLSVHVNCKFSSRNEVLKYEEMWHKDIYMTSMNEMLDQYPQNALLETLMIFGQHYPQYPTISEVKFIFDDSVLLKKDDMSFLKQFMLQYDRLQAGDNLLPDLVEFYQWLHVHLAHIVSRDRAAILPIEDVVNMAARRLKQKEKDKLANLFQRLKENYNRYVQLIDGMIGAGACGAVHRGNQISKIEDQTALLHFLSDTDEVEEGNDWLYNVMVDIIKTHNEFIEGLFRTLHAENRVAIICLFPSEPHKISVTEFSESHCIVRQNCTRFLQLAYSRWHSSSSVVNCAHEIDFDLLQTDIIKSYCIGKPLIDEPKEIRSAFKFRSLESESATIPAFVASSSKEVIEMLKKTLPSNEQSVNHGQDDRSFVKQLEFEFHSANYFAMLEAVQILNNVFGHLTKESISEELHLQTIHQFMTHLGDQSNCFFEHNIRALSPSQLKFIQDIPIHWSLLTYENFLTWIEDELYNFHYLNYTVKSQLQPEDKKIVQEIPSKWKGDVKILCEELRALIENLANSEQYLMNSANEDSQMSVKTFLVNLSCFEDKDMLPNLIPDTIILRNYVYFRIELKRLITSLELSISTMEVDYEKMKWQEAVLNLWIRFLPHFRDANRASVYATVPIPCGFGQEGFIESGLMDDIDDFDTNVGFQPSHDYGLLNQGNNMDGSDFKVLPSTSTAEENTLRTELIKETNNEFSEDEVVRANAMNVADFIKSLGMNPIDIQVSGGDLLSMAEDDINKTFDIGLVDSFKLRILFRRNIQCTQVKYTISVVQEFLKKKGLQGTNSIVQYGIDGDMLLLADDRILKRIGIRSALDRLKIRILFPRYAIAANPSYSISNVIDWLKCNGMDQYVQKFSERDIDGDLILNIDEESLKELEIDNSSCLKIVELRNNPGLLNSCGTEV